MRRPSVREGAEEVTNEAMVEDVVGNSSILRTFRAEPLKKPPCVYDVHLLKQAQRQSFRNIVKNENHHSWECFLPLHILKEASLHFT